MCFKYTLISFVKILQKKGLKELAELTIKESLSILKKDIKKHPIIIFVLSLTKLKPFCQIKSIKISGNIYKIPVEITKNKQQTIILKWIIFNVLQNSKLSLKKKITKEIIDSLNRKIERTKNILLRNEMKVFIYYRHYYFDICFCSELQVIIEESLEFCNMYKNKYNENFILVSLITYKRTVYRFPAMVTWLL